MANATEVISAIRELSSTKQLDRTEMIELLKDGLHAALVKRYGPNVRAEISIDELKGTIRIVVLKTVVEAVEDLGRRSRSRKPATRTPISSRGTCSKKRCRSRNSAARRCRRRSSASSSACARVSAAASATSSPGRWG